MNNSIIILCGFFAIYIVLIIQYFIKKKKGKVEVEATVVDVIEEYVVDTDGNGGNYVYLPTMEYEWNGYMRRVESNVLSSRLNLEVGDKVILLIDPKDGSNFYFKDTYRDPFAFVLLSPIFIFLYILYHMAK